MQSSILLLLSTLATLSAAACLPSGDASTINTALQSGGTGAVIQLCPNALITITTTGIAFTAPNQELSTQGYPTDTSRATIRIAPGSTVTTAIWGRWTSGVKVLNLQIDGNRPNAGLLGGDALIEMGGGAAGQVVSWCVVRDTRSWSCLHYIGSGQEENPCREGTVTHNTIGPCGNEGTDEGGNARWADGVSFECVNSEVSYNDIFGTTDGAIVIFGAPGSHFIGNIITSSETDLGFGAFNMVDPTYAGNYSGVVVSQNTIIGVGTGFFNLGVGIGNNVWSNPNDLTYIGPATITDNTFIGNIGFSVVVNGWSEGLTITGNDVSQVTTPTSTFADASNCQPQVKTSLADNEQLIAYLPSISGPVTLQSDFTDVPLNATIWMCLQHPAPPLPSTQSFAAGSLTVTAAQSTVVNLANFHVQLQGGDGNLVGYNVDPVSGDWTPAWASSFQTANCGGDLDLCEIRFGADGDLVEVNAAGDFWHTGTAGRGQTVVFSNVAPYLEILDGSGSAVWTIAEGVVLF